MWKIFPDFWVAVWKVNFLRVNFSGGLFCRKNSINKFDPRIRVQNSGVQNFIPRIRPQIRVLEVQDPCPEICPCRFSVVRQTVVGTCLPQSRIVNRIAIAWIFPSQAADPSIWPLKCTWRWPKTSLWGLEVGGWLKERTTRGHSFATRLQGTMVVSKWRRQKSKIGWALRIRFRPPPPNPEFLSKDFCLQPD